jgi:hypothetical protein
MEQIKLSAQVFNGLMQYLNTKPHGEVRQLIDAITREVQEQQKEVEDATKHD